jgi:hypothetical protein
MKTHEQGKDNVLRTYVSHFDNQNLVNWPIYLRDRRCCDRMVVVFTTTYAISVFNQYSCEFESR